MSGMTSLARIVWSVVVGGLLGAVLAVGGPAAPAAAHATLLGTSPADGEVLPDPPDRVVLRFSEPVRLIPGRILVVGPEGDRVAVEEPRVAGAEVIVPVGEALDTGTYLVSFRVVSQDSHPVGGSVTYSVGAPSEVPELSADAGVGDPVVNAAVSVNKYLSYAGLVLVIGPALMLGYLWPHRVSRRGAARLLWCGLGLVGVSTLAGLWLQAPYRTGGSLSGVTGADLREVLATPFGAAHLVRAGVLGAVAVLLGPLLAGRASRWDRLLLAGLGLVGIGTWAFAGHPVASPLPAVSIVADTAHLGAAAFWTGGLVVLAGILLRRADQTELAALLPEWSRWAALAVVVLLVAGVLQAAIEIGPLEALATTAYGRLLLVKVGLVGVVVGVAGYSRRLVRRRLGARRPGAMRAAVAIEALVLAGVMVMSAVLVQTTPGRTEAAGAALASVTDFTATLDSELYSLQVQVLPAERGSNQVHLYAYAPDGDPQPVTEWRATAALPAAGVEPLDLPLEVISDNHAFGEVELPATGDWEFRFTLRVSEIDRASVGTTVPIS